AGLGRHAGLRQLVEQPVERARHLALALVTDERALRDEAVVALHEGGMVGQALTGLHGVASQEKCRPKAASVFRRIARFRTGAKAGAPTYRDSETGWPDVVCPSKREPPDE